VRYVLVRIATWILAVGLFSGCETVQTTRPGAVGVEREQTMLVSSATVNRSAENAYRRVLAEAQRRGRLNTDPAQLARVRQIAARLIGETALFRADAPGWKWEVNVIAAKEVNAWCMPGGKIAVYTGLLERLHPDDDELAAVLGHEIAHALREHGRERASQALAQGIGLTVLGIALGMPEAAMDLTQLVLDLTFNLPNSRAHEVEADRIGVELAARAGYDPRAAARLWEKMQRVGRGQPPEFFSTHPAHATRIAELRETAERVRPLYEAARARR